MPTYPRSLAFIAALTLCLSISAYSAGTPPRVVASIAPLHSLVSAIMQDIAEPRLLLHGGESPHTFSLRPSDARMLHDADLVFWIGPALELPLARILERMPSAKSVTLLSAPGVETLPARDIHDLAGAGAGAEAHASHGKAADHLVDPHIWLSPGNALAMSDTIERTLIERDPGNAQRYRANARRLRARLEQLDLDLRHEFQGIDAGFIVYHDAYQYLEHRYDLHAVGSVTSHAERSPGAAHLRELREKLADGRVQCVFSEPQYAAKLLRMLQGPHRLRHVVLDPLGVEFTAGPDLYERMMRLIAEQLSGCLQATGT